MLPPPWQGVERLIPDDQATIAETPIDLVDRAGCDLVLTTGGTGPTHRDVTPRVTLAVTTKGMLGFDERVRQVSLHFVPATISSRQVAVTRETPSHTALIINLPGQLRAIREMPESLKDMEGRATVPDIFAAVPYCIDLVGDPYIETRNSVVKAWRPKRVMRVGPLQV